VPLVLSLLFVIVISEKITSLPGLPKELANVNMYSGYINVNESHGRRMFYWFIESLGSPSSDPLVLWLNGGPGCSSLEGLLGEHGPFFPDGKGLQVNPFAWNKVANVIYLESPSGVGFSYSDTSADYKTGDFQTANDSLTFLLEFLDQFPSYSKNKLWLTGESYAGHYVPNLAKRILDYNSVSNRKLNLAGFMAGNPWTDAPTDNYGAAEFWESHAINSFTTFEGIKDYCDFSSVGPLRTAHGVGKTDPLKCDRFLRSSTSEMGSINMYDIYEDVCLSSRHSNGQALLRALATADTPFSVVADKVSNLANEDPCIDDHVTRYLNRADVQKAIHANISYNWNMCSSLVDYSRTDLLHSMLPTYQALVKSGLSILVYSGDVDAVVPYTGTRQWVDSMNLNVVEAWRPWVASDGQVGGYITHFEGLSFATVRNAGHMVPWTQPRRALDMFSRFLKGQTL